MSIHGGIVRATGGVSTNELGVVSTNIDEQVTVSTNLLQQSVDNAMAEFDIRGASELEMDEQAEMNFSWCVPGFFYTLQSGATLKGIRPVKGATKPSTSDSQVILPVSKPGERSGFFRLSVSDRPEAPSGSIPQM